jgi:hypothetical protein
VREHHLHKTACLLFFSTLFIIGDGDNVCDGRGKEGEKGQRPRGFPHLDDDSFERYLHLPSRKFHRSLRKKKHFDNFRL